MADRMKGITVEIGGDTTKLSQALSGIVFCGNCGGVYRRITWNPHGRKMYVWRCRLRMKDGAHSCPSRAVHEEALHEAAVRAIRQTICNPKEEYGKIEDGILGSIGTGYMDEIKGIDSRLTELQDLVVENVNKNTDFDHYAEEIEALREKKICLTKKQAVDVRNEERIHSIRADLKAGESEALSYDDKLVRDFIEKIEIFPEKMRITMKDGITTEVNL